MSFLVAITTQKNTARVAVEVGQHQEVQRGIKDRKRAENRDHHHVQGQGHVPELDLGHSHGISVAKRIIESPEEVVIQDLHLHHQEAKGRSY